MVDLAYASIFIPSHTLIKKMHSGEMAKRVKAPTVKPGDLRVNPGTYAFSWGKYRNTGRWN